MVDGSWTVTIVCLIDIENLVNVSWTASRCNLEQFFPTSVFNVTDQDGKKITDEGTLNYIEKVRVVLILATLKTSCVFLPIHVDLSCCF